MSAIECLNSARCGPSGGPIGLPGSGRSTVEVKQLNLLTLHSAKGTEYDVVIILGLDQSEFPSPNWADNTSQGSPDVQRFQAGPVQKDMARRAVAVLGWPAALALHRRKHRMAFMPWLQAKAAMEVPGSRQAPTSAALKAGV